MSKWKKLNYIDREDSEYQIDTYELQEILK